MSAKNTQLLDGQNASILLNACASVILLTGATFALFHFARSKTFKNSENFVQKASAVGTFEIKSSQLILDHSDNDDVREFAETMIDDHTNINDESNDALSQSGISDVEIEEKLDSMHKKMFDKLNRVLDNKLDSVYIEAQKKAHVEAVKLFSDYAKCGDDPVLRDFAARVLPTLKHHQEMAQNLTIH